MVNVQGDEPRIAPQLIREVAQALEADLRRPCRPPVMHCTGMQDLFDPNVVKVVLDAKQHALYFSRATIPWARDAFASSRDVDSGAGCPCIGTSASMDIAAVSQALCHARDSGANRALRSARAAARAMARLAHRRSDQPSTRPRQASTRRQTWKACAVCSPPAAER